MILDNVPNGFGVGGVIGVPQQIGEVDHFSPIDARFILLDLVGKGSRRLANNLQQALGQESCPSVGRKLIKSQSSHHIFDFGDGLENVP